MVRLAVVNSGRVPLTNEGDLVVDDKTASGMLEFKRRWPGDVVMVGPADTESAQTLWMPLPDGGELEVAVGPSFDDALRHARCDVGYLTLAPMFATAAGSGMPYVLAAENPPAERRRQSAAGQSSRLNRARIAVGSLRQEHTNGQLTKQARGIQCNGVPAFDYYSARGVAQPMLYFDSRIQLSDIEFGEQTPKMPDDALRVAFSGRLISMKGPEYAVRAVALARFRGAHVRLGIFGAGPLEPELRQLVAALDRPGEQEREWVTFHGHVPFDAEWIPTVARSVDVLLLPHPQGDPACTYFEGAGLGVPTLGFDNAAWKPLVRDYGLGWQVAQGDEQALADKLIHLASHREEIAAAGRRGREFMRDNTQDLTFDRRVEHLIACLM